LISEKSFLEIIFFSCSIWAWAREPLISYGANTWSKLIEAVYRCTNSSTGSLNLPDQFFLFFLELGIATFFHSINADNPCEICSFGKRLKLLPTM